MLFRSLSFTEDVAARFEAYGWHTQTVDDGNLDFTSLRNAIRTAKAEKSKPSLIKVRTVIGFGSPSKAVSEKSHGSPLGVQEAAAMRAHLGWEYGEFEVPDLVYDVFRAHAQQGAEREQQWWGQLSDYKKQHPDLAAQFQRSVLDHELPVDWHKCLPAVLEQDKALASRQHSQVCLNSLCDVEIGRASCRERV